MATTAYGLNHPLAVKLWSKKLFREALKTTWAYKFMGTGSNSLCQIKEDLQKSPGDRVRQGLRVLLSGAGVSGDGTLEGNEEALTTYYDDIFIDQLRHAVRSDGKMSEQRIPFSVREEARAGLTDWWSERVDTAFFNQLGGNTGQTDSKYTGMQTAIAPTAGTRIITSGGNTTEASMTAASANSFTVADIDRCVVLAKTASPVLRPIRINGGDYYVMFIHPNTHYGLRQSAATAGSWQDIQRAAIQGGQTTGNPIFNGALGMWNGVVLHESTRIPNMVAAPASGSSGAFSRTIFAGAQAACLAFGQNSGPEKMSWKEELFDYGNQLGTSAGMIWGLKKSVFNSTDFSTIVCTSYSPPVT